MCCDLHGCMPLRPGDDSFLPQLERYRTAGVKFVSLNVGWDRTSIEDHMRMIAHLRGWLTQHADRYAMVSDVVALEEAAAAGKLTVAFDIEGMNAIGDQPSLIALYYELGVRWMLIAYNRNNRVGGGCQDVDSGLTAYGREVIAEMARVGMMLCCAHTGKRTALQAIDLSAHPVIFSHANANAVFNHPRNLDDDVIKACAGRGGLIGISGVGTFLGNNDVSASNFVRHIDHVAQLVGPEHVGLGLDYVFDLREVDELVASAPEMYPPHLYGSGIKFVRPEQLPEIVEALLRLGYAQDAIRMILGENVLRIARAVWRS
ncbi:dipeptidase [Steroidobacter flavus]|uniref:Dipeptidase n=1 Tax=Steroidobacter flavus TaxID=1842136 RepID=A0ABV8SY25_9GAMM